MKNEVRYIKRAIDSDLEFALEEIPSFGVGRIGDSRNAYFGKRTAALK